VEKQKKTKKFKKRICSEVGVLVNSPRGIRGVSPEEEKEGWERFAENECFKPGMKEWNTNNNK